MSNIHTTILRACARRPLVGTAIAVAGLLLGAAVVPPLVNPGPAGTQVAAGSGASTGVAVQLTVPRPAARPETFSAAPLPPVAPAPAVVAAVPAAVPAVVPVTTETVAAVPAAAETVAAETVASAPRPKQRPKQRPEPVRVADPARGAGPARVANPDDLLLLNLAAVRAGAAPVARATHKALPPAYHDIASVEGRKGAFLSVVLPLVLIANEEILAERRRLSRAYAVVRTGGVLSAQDVAWLDALAARYNTDPADIDELLTRVDIVPPALALAQAAEESGWGSSRFARQGNALFGEWTWTETEGIIPAGRPAGATYAVKAFDSLLDSVRSYAGNLNTNAAYADLRSLRAAMRAEAEALDAARLAGTLLRYSQRGQDYVRSLRAIIRVNDLDAFTTAKLSDA